MAALVVAWCTVRAATVAAAAPPKCQRLAAFGLNVASTAGPGEFVDLEITVSKKSKCFSKPWRCTVILNAPDGAVVEESLVSLAEEANVNDDFSQNYAWSLANLWANSRGVSKGKRRQATIYTLPVSPVCRSSALVRVLNQIVFDSPHVIMYMRRYPRTCAPLGRHCHLRSRSFLTGGPRSRDRLAGVGKARRRVQGSDAPRHLRCVKPAKRG